MALHCGGCPNYHRVHHSLTPEHIDRNFVNWFPIWDIIFGTAVAPRWRELPSTGVAGISVGSLRQAYLLPFAGWRRMISTKLNYGRLGPNYGDFPGTSRRAAHLTGGGSIHGTAGS